MVRALLAAAFAAVSTPGSADAQLRESTTRPTLRPGTPSGGMAVDGRLAEASWSSAPPADGFVQREPLEGAPAAESTVVRVLVGESSVWIGARMYDRNPAGIVRQLVRRDEEGNADWFEVGFDTNRDRRTGFVFRVSAANVQRDEYVSDDSDRDEAWDAVWESAVTIDSLGWVAEIRIPLSQLRFRAAAGEQTWGINFLRRRVSTNEETHYSLISRTQQGIVSQYATLEGVNAQSGRRLELRPYVLGSLFRGPAEQGNPFRTGRDATSRAGLDIKLGLGGQFTLDATVNPDFGQVEADPAVINLGAFEQFFEERRPFFVEDAQIFDFSLSGGDTRLYYSRRLGREPRGGQPDDAQHAEIPASARILGAAKLTGRTANGLSIGALAAVTERASGRAVIDADESMRRFTVEPRAEFGVVRLRQDFSEGTSTIGAIATGVRRELPGDHTFDFLPSSALSGGFDWEHQWGDRTWAFFGYGAASHVRGDPVAMTRVQRASNHFFQRPDSRVLRVDSSATSLTGFDWRMTIEKRRGRHWTGSVWAAEVTPGFEINDFGFSTRQEVLDAGAEITYREITPGRFFRAWNVSVSTFQNWSHDAIAGPPSAAAWGRAHVQGQIGVDAELDLLNFWSIDGDVSVSPELMDRVGTRGGPLLLRPRQVEGRFNLRTDSRRPVSLEPGISFERAAQGSGNELELSLEVGLRPSSRLQIEIQPEFTWARLGAQFVGSTTSLPYGPTFGRRYLFGEVARRELGIETRINATFSPKLSFQLFAQPLLSSGDFSNYKQLVAPRSFSFDRFGEGTLTPGLAVARCEGGRTCVDSEARRHFDFDGDGTVDHAIEEQDFNVRSLIGNAVLRWEYRPGSTLFFVWQRQQEEETILGDFDVRRDLRQLWQVPANNVFLVKASYWFPL